MKITCKELIENLNEIKDKNKIVVFYYDAWYVMIEKEHMKEMTLYTDDNCRNLVDYRQDNDEPIECFRICKGG